MSSEGPHSTSGAPSAGEHDGASWIAIVAYLTIVGWVIALVAKQSSPENNTLFNRFHVRQSLGLMLAGVVLLILNGIPVLGPILNVVGGIALLVLWIMGLVAAVQKREEPLPYVGPYFQEWFQAL